MTTELPWQRYLPDPGTAGSHDSFGVLSIFQTDCRSTPLLPSFNSFCFDFAPAVFAPRETHVSFIVHKGPMPDPRRATRFSKLQGLSTQLSVRKKRTSFM
jgi:hypothetical protein